MLNFKVENEVTLSREELADWLADLADALREDGSAQLPLAGPSLTLALSDEMNVEIEATIDGDDVELELEVSWSTRKGRASEPRDTIGSSADAEDGEDDADTSDSGADAGAAKSDSTNAATRKEGAENGAAQTATRTSSASSSGSSSGSVAPRGESGRPSAATRASGKTSATNGAEASRPRS